MAVSVDVRVVRLALGVEGVEPLIEAFLRRFARVEGTAEGLPSIGPELGPGIDSADRASSPAQPAGLLCYRVQAPQLGG